MAVSTEEVAKAVRTLTVAQSKKTLGNKKKKVVRNLLVNPFENFWPSLNDEENSRLATVMERVMAAEQPTDAAELKGKDLKRERSLTRKKWIDSVVFGTNNVSRVVREGSAVAVLLAGDVDPKFLVQHVATLSAAAAVPVLVIPSLRMFTRSLFGFASIVLGLKKSVSALESNPLHEMYQLILELAEHHPPPQSILQYRASFSKRDDKNGPGKPTSKCKKSADLKDISTDSTRQVTTPANAVHLYRPSREQRVFTPTPQFKAAVNTEKVAPKPAKEWGDFVSLGADESEEEPMEIQCGNEGISYSMNSSKKQKKDRTTFVPFKYVRVRPNPNKKAKKSKKSTAQ